MNRTQIQLERFESASAYIHKKYKHLKIRRTGSITLGSMIALKKELLDQHTLGEIESLKLSLEGQVENHKQINSVISIFSFILTSLFTVMIFYLGNLFRVDMSIEEYMKTESAAFNAHMTFLAIVLGAIVIAITLFLYHVSHIIHLSKVVTAAYEEKKGQEK